MKHNELEIVPHNPASFRIFLVDLMYRTPHTHKDFELSCVLDGAVDVTLQGGTRTLKPRNLFLVNPYESHELHAEAPTLIVSLQISPDYFRGFAPSIEQTAFDSHWLKDSPVFPLADRAPHITYSECLLEICESWCLQYDMWELQCCSVINALFYSLFKEAGYHLMSDQEQRMSEAKGRRMRKLIKYIDAHYQEKLLLSDIAEQQQLSLHYLSHFFKDTFGMSFQDYLSRIRCEHARQLLLSSDLNLLDISMSCGFSDPKYFNRDFKLLYGRTPKEYRRDFEKSGSTQRQLSMLTTQQFLSREESLMQLSRIRSSRG